MTAIASGRKKLDMRIREAAGISYLSVRPSGVIPHDAFEKKEMMSRLLNSAVHAALLGIRSGVVVLMSGDASAALGDKQHAQIYFVSDRAQVEPNAPGSLSTDRSAAPPYETGALPNEYLANIRIQITDRYGKMK